MDYNPLNPEIDRIKIKLYEHFYKNHQELFRQNRLEYFCEVRKYIENKIQQWIYYGKDPLDDITKKKSGLEGRIT